MGKISTSGALHIKLAYFVPRYIKQMYIALKMPAPMTQAAKPSLSKFSEVFLVVFRKKLMIAAAKKMAAVRSMVL